MMEQNTGLGEYPYNLLLAAKGRKRLMIPQSLTKDVQAGIAYALFLLEKAEQEVLNQKFRLGLPLDDKQQQIERKALQKLSQPRRWDYICYGIAGCMKNKTDEARRRGLEQGYQEGYAAGIKTLDTGKETPSLVPIMDLPIETMPFSTRVCNALSRNGCRTVRDVATQNIGTIQRMRNLGTKGIEEVLTVLRSYGFAHTEWELF
ncbi:MAG: hypothetical protein J6J12_07975 [Oscillospiraceae bacterium]|nr:hypothetical protein [Oscillospiraceae bacterium]